MYGCTGPQTAVVPVHDAPGVRTALLVLVVVMVLVLVLVLVVVEVEEVVLVEAWNGPGMQMAVGPSSSVDMHRPPIAPPPSQG